MPSALVAEANHGALARFSAQLQLGSAAESHRKVAFSLPQSSSKYSTVKCLHLGLVHRFCV